MPGYPAEPGLWDGWGPGEEEKVVYIRSRIRVANLVANGQRLAGRMGSWVVTRSRPARSGEVLKGIFYKNKTH